MAAVPRPTSPVPPGSGWAADGPDRHEEGELPVRVFELEPTTGTYVPMGIHRERLALDLPFPIDLDLTDPRRRP
ncbi:hypothetical protein [Kitasatospora sp. NBC_01539]|uniref:hypothetical protein n=1 Tax=Kitasatospora sp. NBC_01539 TaxID=2903577 RepID=UPI003860106A